MVDVVELSQKLIRCPSVTPRDEGSMDVVEEALAGLGFTCHRLPFGGVENLYARLGDSGSNLCFAGHVDVVPIGDADAWEVDPFAAEIKDGVLIGRGAVDMKPAIAAWIGAVADMKSQINGSISLLITGDEEGEAINGTRKVLEWLKERGEQVDACVVGEPTNPEKLGEMIKIGRRGSMAYELTVRGTQGHSAYPNLADNPVTKLIRILSSLVERKLDDGTEFFQSSNLEVTSIDVGNSAANVIPAEAKAKINIRFNDQHSRESLTSWIRETAEEFADDYSLDHEEGSEAFLTEPGKLSSIVSEAVKEVTGMDPELGTTGGTSDARFIKDICPVVEFGLMNKTAHKVNEQVTTDGILALKEVYKKVMEKYSVNGQGRLS